GRAVPARRGFGQIGRRAGTVRPTAHHRLVRAALPELTERLRRRSRKVTGPRQAILQILREHSHPMSNREIFAALPRDDCDLATVYRSIHLLENMGMVKRFEFGDRIARFELIAE